MTLFGWDASDYDWGRGPMDLAAARKAGISLFTHKVSEGKPGWFRAVHAAAAFQRAKAAGFPVVGGYHVLHPADMGAIDDQVGWYVDSLNAVYPGWRDHPCFVHQIDAEKFEDMTRRPSLAEIHQFGAGIIEKTGCAPSQVLAYAPEWLYGDNLQGLRFTLWASSYGANAIAAPAKAYPGDSSAGWQPYSGITPTILQFGSQTVIGSQHTCDANAIRVATEDELVALFTGDTMPTAQDVVDELLKPKNAKALGEALQPAIRTTVIDKDGGTLAQYVRQIRAALDPKQLAAEIAAGLPAAGGGATPAQVADAVEKRIRAIFADAGSAG